jgi:amino acid permease
MLMISFLPIEEFNSQYIEFCFFIYVIFTVNFSKRESAKIAKKSAINKNSGKNFKKEEKCQKMNPDSKNCTKKIKMKCFDKKSVSIKEITLFN